MDARAVSDIGTPTVPANQRTARAAGSVKVKDIQSELTDEERRWADTVLKVLKLKSKGSQARLIAGAVAGAQFVHEDPAATTQMRQQAGVALQAVLAAGKPPWRDARKAQAATAAKVELDFLSLGNAPLQALGQDGGVNSAYWVERKDADGAIRASFLCKPANAHSNVCGVPAGGEVAREALASRAAQHFTAATGLDVGMPESHIFSLDSARLPADARAAQTGMVTCSVQEARPADGMLMNLDPARRKSVPAKQVAALALFDTMTLNVDRHRGNIMLDAGNNLIPIDHGGSFPDPAQEQDPRDVLDRIRIGLSGPHNALLSFPAAHEPLTDDVIKPLKGMKTNDYREELKADRSSMGQTHPEQAKLVSDTCLSTAQRAAYFVKLAAQNDPPLSPAAIQIALGSEANPILMPNVPDADFEVYAKSAIKRIASRQDVVKDVCLASNAEYGALVRKLKESGWTAFARTYNGSMTDNLSDPLVMLSILHNDLTMKKRDKFDDEATKKKIVDARRNMPSEHEMQDVLAAIAREEAQKLIPFLPIIEQKPMQDALDGLTQLSADDQRRQSRVVLNLIADSIEGGQKVQLQTALASYDLPTTGGASVTVSKSIGNIELLWVEGEFAQAADSIQVFLARCKTSYPAKAQPSPNLRRAQAGQV